MLRAVFLTLVAVFVAAAAATERESIAEAPRCTQAKPSTKRNCSIEGSYDIPRSSFYYPYVYDPIKAASVEDCAYYCARRGYHRPTGDTGYQYCSSFSFNSRLKSCQLFNGNLATVLGTEKKSGPSSVYYDHGCFNCGPMYCDTPNGQPYGIQLLDNGDFENEYTLGLWAAVNVEILNSSNNTYVALKGPTEGVPSTPLRFPGNNPSLFQGFDSCPHKFYEMSFDYAYASIGDFGSRVIPQIASYEMGSQPPPDGWAIGIGEPFIEHGIAGHARVIFQAAKPYYEGGHTAGFFSAPLPSNWTFALDNVAIVRRHPPSFKPRPGSGFSVPNGDFESGSVAPWVATSYPAPGESTSSSVPSNEPHITYNVTSPGLSGSNYALQLFPENTRDYVYSVVGGTFPVKPNTMYLMSAEIANGYTEGNGILQLDMTFNIVSGTAMTTHTFSQIVLDNGTTYSWPLWAAAKTAELSLDLVIDGSETNVTEVVVLLDNFRLEEMEGGL